MLDLEPTFALPYFLTGGLKVAIVALRKPKLHDEKYMKPGRLDFLFWTFTIMCVWPFVDVVLLKWSVFPPVRSVYEPPPQPIRRVDLAKDAVTDFCIFGVLFYLSMLYFKA